MTIIPERGAYWTAPEPWGAVIPITKCASSSLRDLFDTKAAQKTVRQHGTPKKAAAIVREPWERYVSGVCTWLSRNPSRDLKSISANIVQDEHTGPQFEWLSLFGGCKVTLCRIEHCSSMFPGIKVIDPTDHQLKAEVRRHLEGIGGSFRREWMQRFWRDYDVYGSAQ